MVVKAPKPPAQRGIPLHADSIQFWAERQKQLQRNLPRWNQFRSSLDAIRQTHRAIEAYNHSNGELSDDQRYLAIYGLLQALVVQQDAMCHLAEALGTKPVLMSRHKRLEEIRNIRNWTVGHPTKIDRYDTHSHHAIQRPQLGRGGFSLYSAFDDGREQYTYVPLVQLARLQRRVVARLLRDMLRELNARRQPKKNATDSKPQLQKPSRVAARPAQTVGTGKRSRGASKERVPASLPVQNIAANPARRGSKEHLLPVQNVAAGTNRGHRGRQERLLPVQNIAAGTSPTRRGATAHISPALQRWVGGHPRSESRRDDTFAPKNRRDRKHGMPRQTPPHFGGSHRVPKSLKKTQPRHAPLQPLPGEHFARHDSAPNTPRLLQM